MCVAENSGRPPELRVNLRAQPARRGRPQSYNRREVISVNNPGARRRPLSLGSNWTCTDTLISVWKTLSRRPSSSCLASWPPRNCEVINGYCLKPLSLWYLLCSPQQRTQEVTEGRDPGGEGKETVSSRRGSPSSSPLQNFPLHGSLHTAGSRETHLGLWLVSHSFCPHGIFTMMSGCCGNIMGSQMISSNSLK